MVKVLGVTRIERRAVVELMGGYLDLLMQTEDFLREFEKIHETKWDVNLFKKFSLTQASEFQIKEILQLLESQSSVQIIANENNTNAIYYKIEIQSVLSNKLLLKYLNHYLI
jgi:hypothetical protein